MDYEKKFLIKNGLNIFYTFHSLKDAKNFMAKQTNYRIKLYRREGLVSMLLHFSKFENLSILEQKTFSLRNNFFCMRQLSNYSVAIKKQTTNLVVKHFVLAFPSSYPHPFNYGPMPRKQRTEKKDRQMKRKRGR